MKLTNNQKRIFAFLLLLIGLECYSVQQIQLTQAASEKIVSVTRKIDPDSGNVFEKITGINSDRSVQPVKIQPTPKWGIGFLAVGTVIFLSTFLFKEN